MLHVRTKVRTMGGGSHLNLIDQFCFLLFECCLLVPLQGVVASLRSNTMMARVYHMAIFWEHF